MSLVTPPLANLGPPDSVWIETKTPEGKSYYYHSKTRETSWNRPEGAVILTQEQFAAQAAAIRPLMRPESQRMGLPGLLGQRPLLPLMPNAGILPGGFNPSFGHNPSRFPPNGLPQSWVPHQVQTATSFSSDSGKTSSLDNFIDPEIKNRCNEWIEYKTQEGKPYYFNTKSQQSVWDKPKALLDYEDALEKAKTRRLEANRFPGSANVVPVAEFQKSRQEVSQAEVITLDNGHEQKNSLAQGKASNEAVRQPLLVQPEVKVDKSKPISSTPVERSPWCVVWTGDLKVFFYNPSTKTSVWERPPELANRPDVDKLLKEPPKEEVEPVAEKTDKRDLEPDVKDEVVAKKQKKEEEKENKKELDPEILAAKKREEVPIEERIAEFKVMLAEKKVSAFSTWEKELHKIVFDPRYLLLTSKERKMVFDDFVRDRAEEERNERRMRFKKARDDFKNLLTDSNVSLRTSFSEFCRKNAKEERFLAIEKMREKEQLFNEYLSDLRRKEKEEVAASREKCKAEFLELLRDTPAIKNLERRFKWSEARELLKHDPRYRAIESSSEKEDMVRNFISQLTPKREEGQADDDDDDDEEEKKERERQERMEASLRQRKQEVEKEMSGHLKEREKEREQHKKNESIEVYNALLSDLVKSSDMTWKECRRTLSKDRRMDLVEHLSREEQELLFAQHLEKLERKKRDKFHEMLGEVKDLTLVSSWREIRRSIKEDSRYLKFSSSDRKCEREFKEFMRIKLDQAKNELRTFLTEIKILTHKSKKLIEESDQHLQEIISVLQNDKRYLNLEPFEDERREILMAYVDELAKKGPPPPPTASEPVRKKATTTNSNNNNQ